MSVTENKVCRVISLISAGLLLVVAVWYVLVVLFPDGLLGTGHVVQTQGSSFETNADSSTAELQIDSSDHGEDIRTDSVYDNGKDTAYIRLKKFRGSRDMDDRMKQLIDLKGQWQFMNPRKKILRTHLVSSYVSSPPDAWCIEYEWVLPPTVE